MERDFYYYVSGIGTLARRGICGGVGQGPPESPSPTLRAHLVLRGERGPTSNPLLFPHHSFTATDLGINNEILHALLADTTAVIG